MGAASFASTAPTRPEGRVRRRHPGGGPVFGPDRHAARRLAVAAFQAGHTGGNFSLRWQVGTHVCSALRIPAALFVGADGSTVREAYRQLLVSTLQPLAALLGSGPEGKLEVPAVRFNFRRLAAEVIRPVPAPAHLAVSQWMEWTPEVRNWRNDSRCQGPLYTLRWHGLRRGRDFELPELRPALAGLSIPAISDPQISPSRKMRECADEENQTALARIAVGKPILFHVKVSDDTDISPRNRAGKFSLDRDIWAVKPA